MREKNTPYGLLRVGEREELHREAIALLDRVSDSNSGNAVIGLTGGSTPKGFFRWAAEGGFISERMRRAFFWSVSDERHEPRESEASNFGNADRLFLTPMGIPEEKKLAWPFHPDPTRVLELFSERWIDRFGPERCFEVCFLGLGEDCHTASLFPGSPLLHGEGRDNFAAVAVPGLGWRFTITATGLEKCAHVVVSVMGKRKAGALRRVFEGPFDPPRRPAQILRRMGEKVHWLVDREAAEGLKDCKFIQ